MVLMSWKQDYSVGIKEIDEQHQRLISLINELHDAMIAGKTKEVLGDVFASLIDYTRTHFTYEEKLLEANHYPDIRAHKVLHASLVSKVLEYKQKMESGELALSIELMRFLKDWLNNHIMGADKKYSLFLNENGLKRVG